MGGIPIVVDRNELVNLRDGWRKISTIFLETDYLYGLWPSSRCRFILDQHDPAMFRRPEKKDWLDTAKRMYLPALFSTAENIICGVWLFLDRQRESPLVAYRYVVSRYG